jgi:hypothetical protein
VMDRCQRGYESKDGAKRCQGLAGQGYRARGALPPRRAGCLPGLPARARCHGFSSYDRAGSMRETVCLQGCSLA